MIVGQRLHVRGQVQGVGFRPHVWRLAKAHHLTGEIRNDSRGVTIEVWGAQADLRGFLDALNSQAPPLARIDSVEQERLVGLPAPEFCIAPSAAGHPQTGIVPDAATCAQCIAESLDPFARRYRYPFTNCTHCGPRFSIARAIPFDRPNTTMDAFELCAECAREYACPEDRRYHAQAIACHRCGPAVSLERSDGKPFFIDALSQLDVVDAACSLLQRGSLLAIKGIGGFNLACDAGDPAAVQRLRAGKSRCRKPFAVMMRDLDVVARYCEVDSAAVSALTDRAAPIVLLPSRKDELLAAGVAPDSHLLGVMLPYTPLHHLLLRRMERPIVMTSGNLSRHPQCIDDDDARKRLSGMVDYFLWHNRRIATRLDDSVVRVIGGEPRQLRRGRGYAPAPLSLPEGFAEAPAVLAMGAEVKNTFCFLRQGRALLSQHMGDLVDAGAFQEYQRNIETCRSLFGCREQIVAVDAHPHYRATVFGRSLAEIREDVSVEVVQHHHAHIAACLADNGVAPDAAAVLGLALDGMGYGADASQWGGEFLLADYRGFTRLGSLKPVRLPGGDQAVRQPWRACYAYLREVPGWESVAGLADALRSQPLKTLDGMIDSRFNAPLSSSCGRLFDAVAATLGVAPETVEYEGEAAVSLEAAAATASDSGAYSFDVAVGADGFRQVVSTPMWIELLADLRSKQPANVIARRFHQGFAAALVRLAADLAREHQIERIALSGGVFQNRLLFESVVAGLEGQGLRVLSHRRTPSNDGGLSLGQAVVAAARRMSAPCA